MVVQRLDTAMPTKRIDKALRQFQGNRVRQTRENLGMTQEELAAHAGLQRQAIVKYEAGENSPTLDVAKRIAKALKTNLSFLSGEIEYEGELTERQQALLAEWKSHSENLGRPLSSGSAAELYDINKFGNDENSGALSKPPESE